MKIVNLNIKENLRMVNMMELVNYYLKMVIYYTLENLKMEKNMEKVHIHF